jgi:hypothetical protein
VGILGEGLSDPALGIEAITTGHLAIRPAACRKPDAVNARRYEQGYAAYHRALDHVMPLFET